ncbi:MAG: hypothetical protein ACJ0FM_03975 [Gammaproteobacteria bacterium]
MMFIQTLFVVRLGHLKVEALHQTLLLLKVVLLLLNMDLLMVLEDSIEVLTLHYHQDS